MAYVYWIHLPEADIKTDGYIGVSVNYKRRWREHKNRGHEAVTGECIEEGLVSRSKAVNKRAQFALNSRSWNKGE